MLLQSTCTATKQGGSSVRQDYPHVNSMAYFYLFSPLVAKAHIPCWSDSFIQSICAIICNVSTLLYSMPSLFLPCRTLRRDIYTFDYSLYICRVYTSAVCLDISYRFILYRFVLFWSSRANWNNHFICCWTFLILVGLGSAVWHKTVSFSCLIAHRALGTANAWHARKQELWYNAMKTWWCTWSFKFTLLSLSLIYHVVITVARRCHACLNGFARPRSIHWIIVVL